MKSICCVCKKLLRDDYKNDGRISHGYCKKDYLKLMADIDRWTFKRQTPDLEFKPGA